MTNRALIRIGPLLGSILVTLLFGASLYAAEPPAVDCSACHDKGKNWPRARTRGFRAIPATRITSRPRTPRASPSPPAPRATRSRPATTPCGVHGQARKNGNEGAPGLRRLPRQRARAAVAQVPGVPRRGAGYLRHVPQRSGGAIPGQRARAGPGARRHAGPAVHRLPRRAQDHQAHQRSFPGERRAHPRHLRELPRQRPADRASSACPPTAW